MTQQCQTMISTLLPKRAWPHKITHFWNIHFLDAQTVSAIATKFGRIMRQQHQPWICTVGNMSYRRGRVPRAKQLLSSIKFLQNDWSVITARWQCIPVQCREYALYWEFSSLLCMTLQLVQYMSEYFVKFVSSAEICLHNNCNQCDENTVKEQVNFNNWLQRLKYTRLNTHKDSDTLV